MYGVETAPFDPSSISEYTVSLGRFRVLPLQLLLVRTASPAYRAGYWYFFAGYSLQQSPVHHPCCLLSATVTSYLSCLIS